MLAERTQSLLEVVRLDSPTEEQMNGAAEAFFESALSSSREDAEAALRELAQHFDLEDSTRGAFLAMICGALVENGCDPATVSAPLIARIAPLLEKSGRLADACIAEMPEVDEEPDEDDDLEDDGEDPMEMFEQIYEQRSQQMPAEAEAWEQLEQFWPPMIAVLSASPEIRAAAEPLRENAAKIAEFHQAGHWLNLMLEVLDNEPIVVIEPATKRGLLARISGVVDNFQLNMLLMDAFPDPSERQISEAAAEVARGEGPQESEEMVTSIWNLYNWQAITEELGLPDPDDYGSSEQWIWNEGTPADIAVFDGRRAVLLGPPSYPRSWHAQRMFDSLPARFEIERELSEAESVEYLQRMASQNA